MKKRFILSLLFVTGYLVSLAQPTKYDHLVDAFFRDEPGTRIHLPHMSAWDRYRFMDSGVVNRGYIANNAEYHGLFRNFKIEDLPNIDFAHKKLYWRSVCVYCHSVCGREIHSSCHRQACSYMVAWFLVDISQPVKANHRF